MKKITAILLLVAIIPTMMFAGCSKSNHSYYYKPTNQVYKDSDPIFTKGCGTDNNGYDKHSPEVDRLISVVPNERQLDYLELEHYSFIHFGMNTFTGREWGTGEEDPSQFNPEKIDTDQWCEAIKASGSKGIIFTAKHHDGFCLWQTDTTEHSIKNSPYKDGKGDIVKELSDSCAKYGLKFGIYLSPWDMNCPLYGKNEYNDFFKAQLTELLDGRYGEIFSVWFDGARGKDAEIDPDFKYDMEGYEEVINTLQPNCVAALQGSDVRWVGNEAGVSRENEWSVVSEGSEASLEYQDSEEGAKKLQYVKHNSEDVGSRELLAKYKNLIFKPAEVDVSIHKGWFFNPKEKPKTLEHLMKIYHKSVGGNSSLLLNVCPSSNGIIEQRDVDRLKEFGDAIKESTAHPIEIQSVKVGNADNMNVMSEQEKNAITSEERFTNYEFKDDEYILDLTFNEDKKVTRIDLREDLRYSQRVEQYDVYAKVANGWQLLANAGNVGNRRSILFDSDKAVTTNEIRIVIKQSRSTPVLRSVGVYSDN